MIPVTCPCCEVPHRPHNTGCTYAADCPSEEADWAEVASLRREVVLLSRKVEALKAWDDSNVRANNEHAKTQAGLRADVARLQADVRRHQMTPEERDCVEWAASAAESCVLAPETAYDRRYGRRAFALRAMLSRTAPEGDSND